MHPAARRRGAALDGVSGPQYENVLAKEAAASGRLAASSGWGPQGSSSYPPLHSQQPVRSIAKRCPLLFLAEDRPVCGLNGPSPSSASGLSG